MSHWPGKYVIGLTGNIATGKSVVRKMLQHSGAYTVDADQLAHQAMMPGAPAYKPVVDTFGQFIIGPDKRINREMLGQIVFSNPEALQKLEAITHPIIRQAITALVGRSKQRIVVIEAIKLLEGDLANMVDAIWVVNASRKTQYIRLVTQRKMSEDAAKQRILAQPSQDAKLAKADVVIENDSDVEKTWKQVQVQWNDILNQLKAQAAQQKPAASTEPAAAPAESAPATPPTPEPATSAPSGAAIGELSVRRGMPSNAQQIADFINSQSGKEPIERMDVMMAFGQKSYLLAQDGADNVVALMGWTVENLVTRMDEFYLKPGTPVTAAVHAIVVAVEEASQELQSEAAFIFLPNSTPSAVTSAFMEDGYAEITLKEIKIPIWREAVEEMLRTNGERQVLWKQLRQDRVLQPI